MIEIQAPNGEIAQFPDGMSDDAIAKVMRSTYGGPSQSGVGMDMLKSGGVGIAEGGIGLAGMFGDAREMAGGATDWAANKLGANPATVSGIKDFASKAAQAIPGMGVFATGPTSADIKKSVEKYTGDFYKPQTIAGEAANTLGKFLPAAAAGPGGLARRLATQVVAPALASETAGQAVRASPAPELESYARLVAGVAGGVGASTAANARASAAYSKALPTTEQIKDAGTAGYNEVRSLGVEIRPDALTRLGNNIKIDLHSKDFRPNAQKETFGALDDLVSGEMFGNVIVGGRRAATFGDLEAVRKRLGDIKPGSSDATAAGRAIRAIDDYVTNLPAKDVVANAQNAPKLSETIKGARANWAAAAQSGKFNWKEYKQELKADTSGTGGNTGNSLRQGVKQILSSKDERRGLSPELIEQMERVSKGTKTGNLARKVGGLSPFAGTLPMMASLGAGALGGVPGLALPALGLAGKAVSDASVRNQIKKLDQMLRAQSPLARGMNVPAPQLSNPAAQSPLLGLLAAQGYGGLLPSLAGAR